MFASSIAAATSQGASAGWFLEHGWLIPLIPAVAFAVIILIGKRLPGKGSEIGIISLAASVVLAAGTAYQWIQRVGDEGGSAGASALLRPVSTLLRSATGGEEHYTQPVIKTWTWWQSGGYRFGLGQHIDGLSVMLLLVVSVISVLVQIYSLEYVRGDRRYTHFFAAMTLFSAGMLAMVLAENMVQLILGWEIMGLCSFMLIGHWWEEQANSRAALKAFFTVRVGDVGLLVGTAILLGGAGTMSIQEISQRVVGGQVSHTVLITASVALFIACIGKSGQFPLHTWLPDAMAGPTPVSSLLHSSTMVVAGVFLVARLYPVFHAGLDINAFGQQFNLIAVIGGVTIIIAAVLAFVMDDIKKVLAYSTVSQLGYMMMALGVGAWTPAVFHLFTHAFFKCCLFLCAGSVSHTGSHHSFDMRKDMGGLAKRMPVTTVCWMLATFALCGVPFFSGFFSKDEIIDNANHNGYTVFFIIGLVGAALTAAYMTRATYLTFFGKARGGAAGEHAHDVHGAHEEDPLDIDPRSPEHSDAHVPAVAIARAFDVQAPASVGHLAHLQTDATHGVTHAAAHADEVHVTPGRKLKFAPDDSPALILVPLMILSFLAVVSGYINAAFLHIEKFTEWVTPVGGQFFPHLDHSEFKWLNTLPSLLFVLAGFGIALYLSKAVYGEDPSPLKGLTRRNKALHAGHQFLVNKYYLDDLYEKIVVHGIAHPISQAAYWTNQRLLDGVVNGVGVGGSRIGRWVYRNIDQRVVDGAVRGSGLVATEAGCALRPV
ncbi:MAG: NADH-quinone oxidoreductase subunit L [Ilumatobacteraceae bacterium]